MTEQANLGEISQENSKPREEKRRPEIKGKAEDWQVIDLQDIVEIKGGGTPSKSNEEYWDGEIPWASVKDLTELTNLWKTETQDYITVKGLEESSSNLIPENSIIISTRMTVGEPFINLEEMSINQDLKGLIPDTEKVNPGFLLYALWGKDNFLKSLGRGTTVSGITTRDLERLGIALPEKDEQRRIASVLYNVDQAISKTEEIIEQTQRVKKGLMQDLFTEGYYSHEEYQDRDLWINMCQKAPNDWEVVKAEEAMTIRRGASPRPKSDSSLFGGDIPWIKIGDVQREKSHFVTETVDTVTEKGKNKSEFVEEGALLVANSGATCGFSILAGKDGCVHDGWLILEDYEPFNKKYLLHFVNWHQDFLQSLAPGSAQTNLNTNRFGLLDLPKPPKEEQEKIAEALDSLDESMFQNRELISQLQRLKKGLMQDLLTGSVRTGEDVRVLDEVVEVEG